MNILGQIKEKVTSYADVYIRLFKINFIHRTSGVLSYLMFAMIGMFIMLCVVLFLGFGLMEVFIALGLSKLAASFIVVGIYLFMLLLLVVCRRPITSFFASGIIKVMTEGDEKEKDIEE